MLTELPEHVGMTSKITGMNKSQEKHNGCVFHFEHKYSKFISVRLVSWKYKSTIKEVKSSVILVYFEWNHHMQFDETLEKTDIGYLKKIFTTIYTQLSFCFNTEEVKLFF